MKWLIITDVDNDNEENIEHTERGIRFAPSGYDAQSTFVVFAVRRQTDGQNVIPVHNGPVQFQESYVIPTIKISTKKN